MSEPYPPPRPYGENEGRPEPPPYGQPYGQPAPGGPQGPPADPTYPPQQPGGHPQQYPSPGQGYPPPGSQPAGGWGQPSGQWGQQPPQGPWDYGAYGTYQEARRPGTVLGGAIMAYIGGALLLLLGLLLLVGSASAQFIEGFAGGAELANVPGGQLRAILLAVGVVSILLGLVVVVLAAFAQKGRNGARIGLTVVGAIYLAVGLFGAFAGPAPQALVGVVYVAISIALFWAGGANAWYRARKAAR